MTFSCRDCGVMLLGLHCQKCGKDWPDPVVPFLEEWARLIAEKEKK